MRYSMKMARSDTAKFQNVRDDDIMVDRGGIPHYTRVMQHLMKEYKQRVSVFSLHMQVWREKVTQRRKIQQTC